MPRIEESIIVPFGPLQSWELMRNLELRPLWDATILEVKRKGVDDNSDTPHLFYKAPLLLGLHWRWNGEYVSFEPPHHAAVRMSWGSRLRPFNSLVGTWIVSNYGGATQIKMVVSFEPRLPLRILDSIMARLVRRLLCKSLLNLSRLGVGGHTCASSGNR